MWIRHRANLGVVLLFMLLSVSMTYPMIADLGSRVPGGEADNLFYVWQLWWVKHSLLDLHISPFYNPYAYYPAGYEVARGELTPANSFLFLPVTVVGGPVVSYNLCLLLSFFASAWGAYLWVHQLTGRRSAALVAGTIFGFLPYRFAHSLGHLELMSTQWMPLSLFALERFIASRQIRWAIAAGLGLALIALSTWYYAYSALVLLPAYVLLRARPWHEYWTQSSWWRGLVMIGLIVLVLVTPFALPYYHLASQGQLTKELDELDSWSAAPYSFFVPSLLHPLWGNAVRSRFPHEASHPVELNISLGLVAVVLSLVAVCHASRPRWMSAVSIVGGMSFLIALGPTLHWAGRQVSLPLLSHIPLPAYWLYNYMPFTASLRVMTRFGVWTGLMACALAGWGTWILLEQVSRRKSLHAMGTALFILVILFESYSMTPDRTLVRPRPVDVWLAQTYPVPVVIVELPLQQTLRPLQDYYATVHQQATIFGPVGDSFYPAKRGVRSDRLRDFPSPSSYEALTSPSWQLSYVLFTPSRIENWDALRRTIESDGILLFEHSAGDVWVYRIRR